jgi:hypothetical protein
VEWRAIAAGPFVQGERKVHHLAGAENHGCGAAVGEGGQREGAGCSHLQREENVRSLLRVEVAEQIG